MLIRSINVLNIADKSVCKFSYCVQCSTLNLFSPDSKDQEFLLGLRKDFVAMQERLDSHLNYRIRRLLRLDVALPCIEFLHLNPVPCTNVSYTLIIVINSWHLLITNSWFKIFYCIVPLRSPLSFKNLDHFSSSSSFFVHHDAIMLSCTRSDSCSVVQ